MPCWDLCSQHTIFIYWCFLIVMMKMNTWVFEQLHLIPIKENLVTLTRGSFTMMIKKKWMKKHNRELLWFGGTFTFDLQFLPWDLSLSILYDIFFYLFLWFRINELWVVVTSIYKGFSMYFCPTRLLACPTNMFFSLVSHVQIIKWVLTASFCLVTSFFFQQVIHFFTMK